LGHACPPWRGGSPLRFKVQDRNGKITYRDWIGSFLNFESRRTSGNSCDRLPHLDLRGDFPFFIHLNSHNKSQKDTKKRQ